MSLQVHQSWEYRLVSWAEEALKVEPTQHVVQTNRDVLDAAYDHCGAITRTHSRTFFLASSLLPEPKRRAVRALYAFCRVTDDIVDCPVSDLDCAHELAAWQRRTSATHPPENDFVALAWADARATFGIPRGYAEQLIQGVSRDLDDSRFQTFSDLAEYAYGVASTVGLMAMHIIGYEGEEAIPYAVKLGVALQITNILRDVGEDWRAGRLYLPLNELAVFNIREEDIDAGRVTPQWKEFMRYQITRNRRLYEESWDGIAMLRNEGRLAIAAAAGFYRDILTDIENHNYDVFSRRAHLSTWGKVRRIPSLWWNTRQLPGKVAR